jgi:hypothetical protein
MKKWLLTSLAIAVYLLHQDYWNWKKIEPLLFGFLPIGLAYHAAYSLVAAGLMALLVRFAWPRELDELEQDAPRRPADAPPVPTRSTPPET